MMLNDWQILKRLPDLVSLDKSTGGINIEQLIAQVNPNSLDVTIGNKILRPAGGLCPVVLGESFDTEQYWKEETVAEKILLKRGQIILAATQEYFQMPADVSGQIFLKSSSGRVFLNHMLAGVIDAGFHGCLTLELRNDGIHDLLIPVGARIAQVVFYELTHAATVPYNKIKTSRYAGYTGPEAMKGILR